MKRYQIMGFVLLSVALIIVCYLFVDRRVVWFLVNHHSRQWVILKFLANNITAMMSVLIFIFYAYFACRLWAKRVTHFEGRVLLICNAVLISQFLKDVLKGIFGRYWAATFICNNPSLVNDHVYGFNWFKWGSAYGSFPSGHTAFICSFAASLWFLFPKFRWFGVSLAILVIIGQIGMYYHFVSDVIAGALLGLLIGLCIAKFYARPNSRNGQIDKSMK